MLPSSIKTFWSLTHALSTLRNVLLARAIASFTAASNPSEEVALISVTVATLMVGELLLPACASCLLFPTHRGAKLHRLARLMPRHGLDKPSSVCKLLVWQHPKKSLHYRIHITTSSEGEALTASLWACGVRK